MLQSKYEESMNLNLSLQDEIQKLQKDILNYQSKVESKENEIGKINSTN